MDIKDLLEKLAGKKIEIEVVSDVDEFLDKLSALAEEEDEEEELEIGQIDFDKLKEMLGINEEEEKEAVLEDARQAALKAKHEIVKEHGLEKAENVIKYASVGVMINSCIELDLPIPVEWVAEFNDLLDEIHPEVKKSGLLTFAYALLEKMRDEGVKSLE